jgi:VWFA-related protein
MKLLAGLLLLAAHQEPQSKITVDVREVLVPVVVTDAKGHHVTSLKQSDFKVFEDGVPQEIVGFSTTFATSASAARQENNAPAPAQRASAVPNNVSHGYLICIDTLHSSFASFSRVRDAVLKVLRQEHNKDSQYALMALGRELTVIKDSTPDAASIAAAVASKDFAKAIQTSEVANTAVAIQDFTALMKSYCAACACESNSGGGVGYSELPVCPSIRGRVKTFLFSFEERTYVLNHNFLQTLYDLVRATATMPTSRTIIFISDGFNRSPGRELRAIAQGFYPRDHSFEFNSRDTEPELENILKLATQFDVKFYTLDSRGVYSSAFGPGNTFDASSAFSAAKQSDAVDSLGASVARENADVMSQLAHDTGGRFYENSNDLANGIARAIADTREYYVLSYVSNNDAQDGKYRKIKVEMNERKLQVSAKAGYWAGKK